MKIKENAEPSTSNKRNEEDCFLQKKGLYLDQVQQGELLLHPYRVLAETQCQL